VKTVTLQDYKARVLKVLVFIQRNLDADLSLERLARVANFSPYHFHRVFSGMVGESVHAHIRRIRLERAADRLRRGSQAITAIAFDAGYDSHEAFTRAFRAMTGLPPSEYRTRRAISTRGNDSTGIHYESGGAPKDFHPSLTGGDAMKVTITQLEPRRVAFMRHVGPYQDCGPVWEALCMQLGSRGLLGPGVTYIGLSYDDPDVAPPDKLRYDACVTVDDDFVPKGDIGVQTISGGVFAVTTHQGPYEKLNETYARLLGEWLPRSGRTLHDGPCREIYLNDPEGTEPEELLTDIYVRLVPAGGDNT